MRIKKIKNTGNPKYPKRVTMTDGHTFRIPQQKEFNSFSRAHGCSLAAVSIALQMAGINKNPTEVYRWAKRHIKGYTGSKLTIYGAMQAINGISKQNIAVWHPVTGTERNYKRSLRRIRQELKNGSIVLVECENPIHTNVLIAKNSGGVWNATNGRLVKTTIPKILRKANKGFADPKKQNNWYRNGERRADSGYVVVRPLKG